VGLKGDLLDLKPAQLSGGMRKRVGLARAIAVDPEIILYDEPTSGLDPVTSEAINDLILDMQRKLKVTSVVVTHDMHSAYKVANRIAMIYDGRIIGSGTPEGIKGSQDPYIRQFVMGSVEGPMPIR
jgi:phospholipid/cholesterol/gamma-HCH transport system ATP-binding protein